MSTGGLPPTLAARLAELRARFDAQLEPVRGEIIAAVGAGDPGTVAHIAHKLAGSAGSFGHQRLTEVARACDDLHRVGVDGAPFLAATDELLAEIGRILDGPSSTD